MLTAKQQQLLMFINSRLKQDGISPSFDEMKDALGLKSKSGIHRLVGALEERGFIRRMTNRARALEVIKLPEGIGSTDSDTDVDPGNIVRPDFSKTQVKPSLASVAMDSGVEIPLHGRIAAGTPIDAIENADSYITVPPNLLGRGDCFALEVSGDSMIELGIMDGDTVVIENCDTARDGEIVVALVDGEEATLKTLKRQGGHVALVPANRDFDTQILEAKRVRVQGRLVGLLRNYH